MAKLKKKYREGFTVVATAMYRDKRLNLKDRGLLGTMMSLPEDWDFSIAGLAAIVEDGESSVRTALQHLEKFKYLKRNRIYENGKVVDWEYIFSDYPMEDSDSSESKNGSENSHKNLDVDFQQLENQQVENLQLENRRQLNIHQENTQEEINLVNDDDIDNSLSVSDSLKSDDFAVVEESNSNSLSSGKQKNKTGKECKAIESRISNENRIYDIQQDGQLAPFSDECQKEMQEFEENHSNTKVPSLYRYEDIALCWIKSCKIYGKSEYIIQAEKMLAKVINSFRKPEERVALTKLNREDFEYLLSEGDSYYYDSQNSKISDLQGWYAAVLRSKIAENIE